MKFALGRIVATPGALRALETARQEVGGLLRRHQAGDWGEVCEEDRQTNEEALRLDERVMSLYTLPGGEVLWIITEWDRSVTTLLLPEEY